MTNPIPQHPVVDRRKDDVDILALRLCEWINTQPGDVVEESQARLKDGEMVREMDLNGWLNISELAKWILGKGKQ